LLEAGNFKTIFS